MEFRDCNEEEFFNERAGIMEFDAGMSREQAEYFAWQQVLKRRERVQNEHS
jgi:hypothetical protein